MFAVNGTGILPTVIRNAETDGGNYGGRSVCRRGPARFASYGIDASNRELTTNICTALSSYRHIPRVFADATGRDITFRLHIWPYCIPSTYGHSYILSITHYI